MHVTKSICDIRFISIILVIFGFVCDCPIPKVNRLIIKSFCILSALFQALMVLTSPCSTFYFGGNRTYLRPFEYVSLAGISVWTNNRYLQEYLEQDREIDIGKYQNRIFKKSKLFINIVLGIIVAHNAVVCFPNYAYFWQCNDLLHFITLSAMRFSIELGRIPVFIIFTTFYGRVKIYQNLVYRGLCEQPRFEGDKYIRIYFKLQEKLAKTLPAVRVMIAVHLVSVFIDSLYIQYTVMYELVVSDIKIFPIIVASMRTIYSYFAVSYPSIILEMAADVMDNIKIHLADRIITSTDPRRIDELNKLMHLLHSQPIEFSLWRAIPLNARLPLGFISLIANYLVCLLQFTHFRTP